MYEIVDEQVLKGRTDSTGKFSSMKLMQVNCDTSADIPEPSEDWAIGSVCFIVDTQEVKFLNSQGEWV